MGNIWK